MLSKIQHTFVPLPCWREYTRLTNVGGKYLPFYFYHRYCCFVCISYIVMFCVSIHVFGQQSHSIMTEILEYTNLRNRFLILTRPIYEAHILISEGSFRYPLARDGVWGPVGTSFLAHARQKFTYIVGLTALRLAFFMGYE